MLEIAQRGQGLGHDVVARFTGQGRDERNTTSVVLVLPVVESLAGAVPVKDGGATIHPGAPVVLRSNNWPRDHIGPSRVSRDYLMTPTRWTFRPPRNALMTHSKQALTTSLLSSQSTAPTTTHEA